MSPGPAGVLLVAALLVGCESDSAHTTIEQPRSDSDGRAETRVVIPVDSPQMARLRVEPIRRMRVPLDVVVAPGKIEVIPDRVARVIMPAPGRVVRMLVGIGAAVREGQPLLAIDSPEATTSVSEFRQSQAAVGEARAVAAKAESDLARIGDLFEHRAIAQKEVTAAETLLAQAQADLERALSREQEARRRLEILGLQPNSIQQEIIVAAPLSGKVLEINVAPGEYRNDTSSPLLVIAGLSEVYMASDVPESLIRLVHVGERVEIRLDAYPDEVFSGRVALISDVVDPQARTIRVRSVLRNPAGGLRPEMFGEMVHEETFREVPVVPPGAVIQDESGNMVYREVEPGVFERIRVKTGRPTRTGVPILEGLAPGDRIITEGAVLLRST